MNMRPIFAVLGVLLITLGFAMIIPASVDLGYGNEDWKVFMLSSIITCSIGGALYWLNKRPVNSLTTRQALVMTTGAWTSLAAFGALPYLFSGVVPHYTDAFFESMSALSTTGATVVVGLDSAPPGVLMWRAIQQWLGGLGIIVMANWWYAAI